MPCYFFVLYLAVLTLLGSLAAITDKFCAMRAGRRIPEKTLFLISLLGGSLGMFCTMRLIRHKTRKRKFMAGLPIIIFLQAAGIYIVSRFFTGQ